MSLLDFEDLYGIPLELNIKTILEEISIGVQGMASKMLSSELFWSKLSLNDTSSIKDAKEVTGQTLAEFEAMEPDFFYERRLLIFKNRLVLLRLLETGESELAPAFDRLLDLNIKEAENVVSQQNLAVVALSLGKTEETNYLLKRAGSASAVDCHLMLRQTMRTSPKSV